MLIPDIIRKTAARYGFDPKLALAVARAESRMNQTAVSPAGAIGVMQLMPATAAWLGVDPFNAVENIDGGVRYLSQLLRKHGGDVERALAAYNWGPGNVDKALSRWGASWFSHLPLETSNYIPRVLGYLNLDSPGSSGTVVADGGPTGEQGGVDFSIIAIAILAGAAVLLLWD